MITDETVPGEIYDEGEKAAEEIEKENREINFTREHLMFVSIGNSF